MNEVDLRQQPDNPVPACLAQARLDLLALRGRLASLARQMERPILEVGAFLESVQDLTAAKPISRDAGGQLVVALQSYDLFHQEVQVAEQLMELIAMAVEESHGQLSLLPVEAVLTNAESACFHLESACNLISGAAADIPHAVSAILKSAGANPQKFQRWSIHRPLDEISSLTQQLGQTGTDLGVVRHDLAIALGHSPDEHWLADPPPVENEKGSVILF